MSSQTTERTWEYGDFASVITPEAMACNVHGFRITRTREWGHTQFQATCTGIVASTWTPAGERSEEEAYRECVDRLQQSLSRSAAEYESEARAIDAGQRRYEAQYAYACGYRD